MPHNLHFESFYLKTAAKFVYIIYLEEKIKIKIATTLIKHYIHFARLVSS